MYAFITPTARTIAESRGGISKRAVGLARPHLPDDVSLERQEILCAGLAGDIDEAVKELAGAAELARQWLRADHTPNSPNCKGCSLVRILDEATTKWKKEKS